jgi:hypothetical protein
MAELKRMHEKAQKNAPAIIKVVETMKTVVSTFIPKNLGMHLLKLKIHVQSLIGNTFGIHFKGLEASKE